MFHSALPFRSLVRRRALFKWLIANGLWRIVFVFLLLAFSFLLLAITPANAQNQPKPEPYPGVEKNIHNGAQIIMLETLSAIGCQITGSDYLHPNQMCIGVNPSTGDIGFTENGGGLIGVMGTLISYTFVPPASSSQYIAYLKDGFGVNKSAYAQIDPNQFAPPKNPCEDKSKGIGFCGLTPVLKLWVAMRNIVYLILILVFVVIGVAIMLRVHIDPRTVMSIQNQIPKIIVGLVVITFSFAIAGLLIDIMWVATYLFGQVISDAAGNTGSFNDVIIANNPFDALNKAMPGGPGKIAGEASAAFAEVIKSVFQGPSSNFGGDPAMDFVGGVLGIIINILGFIIIGVAVLISLIKLWISLILTYLNIILDVVFGPFWIIAGLVPGSPLSLASWFRDLIANLAVFPVVVGFFLLAKVFIDEFGNYGSGRFIPPLVGGVNPEAMSALIGLGFILMLPNLADALKSALKAPKLDFKSIVPPLAAGAAYPVNAIRGLKEVYNKQNEYVIGPEGTTKRGRWSSLLGLNRYEPKAKGPGTQKTSG